MAQNTNLHEWLKNTLKGAAPIGVHSDPNRDLMMLWNKIHEYEQDISYLRTLAHELARRVDALENRLERIYLPEFGN